MGTLEGKTALVTGGSRGIGRGIAERLAADGALVAVHYGSNQAAADETLAAIRNAGGTAFLVRTRLGEPGDAEALWAAFDEGVVEFTGTRGVDIVVNNAGVITYAPIGDTTDKEFDEAFAVNVRAPFFILQHGLFRLRDGGRIINISSATARMALPVTIAYSMTKGALNTLTHTLALELGRRGITVNAVEPGVIDTDIASWLADPQLRERAAALSAFGRIGAPADIADVVAFLASPDARWITGQTIDATGGTLHGFTL
ncbi:SDR family oxidoreductase [Actinocorallia sp. API 0066]|uniref:SDR family oxidoreductase n=1 Tax=Actinocorallia sp. API 0066 TaxID=2896846 RepID=UPI001E62EB69|nr:SDR family oxidoreductase [Actinocorallia sp. API 0066]MCD0449080.1 SDR family oxidoreductase [Actinocorallia sp. API 0066]